MAVGIVLVFEILLFLLFVYVTTNYDLQLNLFGKKVNFSITQSSESE